MDYTDEEIRNLLKALCASPIQTFTADVTAVNTDKYTIDVKPPGRAPILDIRLKAAVDSVKDGVVEIPEVNSTVIIGILGKDKSTAFVIKTSKVTKTIINNGNNGGLAIVEKILDNLNTIKSFCTDMKTATANGFNAVGIGSAANGPAASASFNGEMAGKVINFTNMENTKVIH